MKLAVCAVAVCAVFFASGCTKPDEGKIVAAPDGGAPQKQMSPEIKAKYEADMKANRERMRGNAAQPATP